MNNLNSDFNHVFVYGTLKRDFPNHFLLKTSLFLGNAKMTGELLDIGPFPAIIGQNNGDTKWVYGEVYLVDDDTLARLDVLESEGRLYHRKYTIAYLEEGQRQIAVWAYYWGSHTDYPVIKSGYWGYIKKAQVLLK